MAELNFLLRLPEADEFRKVSPTDFVNFTIAIHNLYYANNEFNRSTNNSAPLSVTDSSIEVL